MVPEAEKAVTGKYAQQVKPGRSQLMLLPDVAQLLIGNSRIDRRVRDRTMTHEGLQRAGIYPASGKGIASAVAKHVDVNWEGKSSGLTKPFKELLGAIDGQRCAALADEQIPAMFAILANESPDQP